MQAYGDGGSLSEGNEPSGPDRTDPPCRLRSRSLRIWQLTESAEADIPEMRDCRDK
jgi:hypothetical protein